MASTSYDYRMTKKCPRKTTVRLWTGFTFETGCIGDAGHRSVTITSSSRFDQREHTIEDPKQHATAPQPLYVDGRYGQILWRA